MDKIICESTGEVVTGYSAYLRTEHWKNKKQEFLLTITDRRCLVCWSTCMVNVHHRTYQRIGREFNDDLIILCEDCHHSLHKIAERLKANGFSDKFNTTDIFKASKRIKHKAREYATKDRKSKYGTDVILRKPNGHEKRVTK